MPTLFVWRRRGSCLSPLRRLAPWPPGLPPPFERGRTDRRSTTTAPQGPESLPPPTLVCPRPAPPPATSFRHSSGHACTRTTQELPLGATPARPLLSLAPRREQP